MRPGSPAGRQLAPDHDAVWLDGEIVADHEIVHDPVHHFAGGADEIRDFLLREARFDDPLLRCSMRRRNSRTCVRHPVIALKR